MIIVEQIMTTVITDCCDIDVFKIKALEFSTDL